MPVSASPPVSRHRSGRWYAAVFSLIGLVAVVGLAGAVHWYSLYAQSLGPLRTSVLHYPPDSALHYPAEEKAPSKSKAEKAANSEKAASSEKAGAGVRTTSDGQADTPSQVGNHKPAARPTSTPGV